MIPEFHYRVPWRAAGARPGGHPGLHGGGGGEFAGHLPFLARPDPRQLDLRASLRDPHGQPLVRSFRQRGAIPVFVVADLSASLGFRGAEGKRENLALFSAAAAHSAYRGGDPFGFVAADAVIRAELSLPPRLRKGAAPELYQRLRGFVPSGRSARALGEAAAHLGRQRALVFLVSDFHFPLEETARLLDSLARHDVVPVVLWDSAESERWPAWGLVYLEDVETGERRRLFLRPALREKLRRAFAERRETLARLCASRGRAPFFIVDRFDPEALTRYFLG